jgi:hypothetical protein
LRTFDFLGLDNLSSITVSIKSSELTVFSNIARYIFSYTSAPKAHIVNAISGSYLVWFGVKAGTEGDIPHHKDGRKGRGARQRQQGVSPQGQSRGDPANQVRECLGNSQSEENPKKFVFLPCNSHF